MDPTFDKFSELLNYLHHIGGHESEWCNRWEYTEGTSNKYWEVYHSEGMDPDEVEVRWGRIGHKSGVPIRGQSVTKPYDETIKKALEKVRKGYKDVGGWFNAGTQEEAGLKPAEADLPEPFSRIVRFVPGWRAPLPGIDPSHVWIGLDEHGAEVLRMPKSAAEKFAQKHLGGVCV